MRSLFRAQSRPAAGQHIASVPSPHHHVPSRRATASGVAAVMAAGALVLGAPAPAQADTSTPAGCSAAGKVWLIVHTFDGRTLANQCVGNPQDGATALENAGLQISRRPDGLICRIAGYPTSLATCG